MSVTVFSNLGILYLPTYQGHIRQVDGPFSLGSVPNG